MKINKIILLSTPLLAAAPAIATVATSCSSISDINNIPRQIDGFDWTGRTGGLFTSLDYFVDTEEKTVTYWNSEAIVAHNLVVPNYVWYRGKKFKVIIDDQCFMWAENITGSVELNDWVTDVPDAVFYGCSGITSVILHSYPKNIGNEAFYECSRLENIFVRKEDDQLDPTWQLKVVNIGDFAFNNTRLFGDLIFSDSLKYIGENAFFACNSIEKINLTFTGLKSINTAAFSNCHVLTEVDLPSGIESIGNSAFMDCTLLEKVVLPNEGIVMSLGDFAFFECRNFKKFSVNPTITSIGEACFFNNEKLEFRPWEQSQNKGMSIGRNAFASCEVVSLTFAPDYISDMDTGAFSDCKNLTIIDFSQYTNPTGTPDWYGEDLFIDAMDRGTIYVDEAICESTDPTVKPNDTWMDFFNRFGLTFVEDAALEGWTFQLK